VLDALMHVVGEEGALVMSAYRVSRAVPLSEAERTRGIAWKVRVLPEDSTERTGMGAIADAFCRRSDVHRGTGAHPVCAWGRDAARHSQGYAYLLDADGWVLLIGVGIDRCSSMHQAEKVCIPREIAQRFEVPENVLKDYPQDMWAVGYGGTPDDAWMKVYDEAQRRGLITRRRIGCAESMLFKARAVVAIYAEARRTDPYGLYGVARSV
jgi:aminoglycoside 3-N-acetyltransferase